LTPRHPGATPVSHEALDEPDEPLAVTPHIGAIFGFLAVAYVIGRLIYFLVIDRAVPGSWDRKYGMLEPLPPDVGTWKTDDESDEGRAAILQGLRRETRLFHDPAAATTLLRQARYRNVATGAVTRVDPDVRVRRKRVKA
jgi:hypothetical protein